MPWPCWPLKAAVELLVASTESALEWKAAAETAATLAGALFMPFAKKKGQVRLQNRVALDQKRCRASEGPLHHLRLGLAPQKGGEAAGQGEAGQGRKGGGGGEVVRRGMGSGRDRRRKRSIRDGERAGVVSKILETRITFV
mmetsp:Transcript_30185/g.55153  ORF Transcript_30185/g.55153 Transcript_30185/m.55153 type:complete len:141 (+) Transcript_30185:484-906(+)